MMGLDHVFQNIEIVLGSLVNAIGRASLII